MKKYAFLILALLVSLSMFSQELKRDIPQNELKLNLGTTIIGSFPEISYERILNSDLSVGASVGFSFDQELYPLAFEFIPYVRWFFGSNDENLQKYGAGFFIEANIGLLSVNTDYLDLFDSDTDTGTEMGAGIGLAVGWKYLTRNNWIGEVYGGLGRDFVNDGIYPRLGVTVGKRF